MLSKSISTILTFNEIRTQKSNKIYNRRKNNNNFKNQRRCFVLSIHERLIAINCRVLNCRKNILTIFKTFEMKIVTNLTNVFARRKNAYINTFVSYIKIQITTKQFVLKQNDNYRIHFRFLHFFFRINVSILYFIIYVVENFLYNFCFVNVINLNVFELLIIKQ